MKRKKLTLILFCILMVTSFFAEKVGEKIMYKEDDMNPTLIPESAISQKVANYWKQTYDKEPIFVAEMLYEVPSNGIDINEISKILSGFENQVLELYLDGLSYVEISEKMDKSLKSIDNALQRIKKKLMDSNMLGK